MSSIREIVFDCAHPARLARFWADALEGYAVRPYDAAEIARLAALGFTPETDPVVLVDGPGPSLCFQKVAQPDAARGRLHFDVVAADRRREVERLRALGATLAREAEGYTVLCDPEGNRFCVADPR
jgi:hypothetical protein